MTRDPFADPKDDRLAAFFDEARAEFVETPAQGLERRHLAAMVEAFEASDLVHSNAPRRKSLMSRILAIGAAKVLAVGMAALIATGTALAAAGSLPDPAQDAVANTVDNVGLNIPGGDDENEAAENEEQEENEQEDADQNVNENGGQAGEHGVARSTTDCPTDFEEGGNHGQYVSGTDPEVTPRSDAAQSDCGKPAPAVENSQAGTHEPNENASEPGEQGRSGEHKPDGESAPGQSGEEHGQGGPQNESPAEGGS